MMQKLDGNVKAGGNTWLRENEYLTSRIPGIINVMIGMSINIFNCKEADKKTLDLLTQDLSRSGCDTQRIGSYLLICFIVCVPIFMCVKPCLGLCASHPEHDDVNEQELAQAAFNG